MNDRQAVDKLNRELLAQALLGVVVITLALFVLLSGTWLSESVAIRTVLANGYSKPSVVDRVWFAPQLRGCGSGDTVRFTVEAINPAGLPARVWVCSGLWKGGTIRVP